MLLLVLAVRRNVGDMEGVKVPWIVDRVCLMGKKSVRVVTVAGG